MTPLSLYPLPLLKSLLFVLVVPQRQVAELKNSSTIDPRLSVIRGKDTDLVPPFVIEFNFNLPPPCQSKRFRLFKTFFSCIRSFTYRSFSHSSLPRRLPAFFNVHVDSYSFFVSQVSLYPRSRSLASEECLSPRVNSEPFEMT